MILIYSGAKEGKRSLTTQYEVDEDEDKTNKAKPADKTESTSKRASKKSLLVTKTSEDSSVLAKNK